MSPLLTTMKERISPIWTKWRAALRVISLCAGLGVIALCLLYSVSLWNRLSSAGSWYMTEVVSRDGTPVYPHAALVNPVVAGIGAVLLIGAALQQAATARRRHKEQTDADRQRRITESYIKAVEQLASDKMEMRLGGIYTLERISRESPDDYWTVMETLCAFVRERARWKASEEALSETMARFYAKAETTESRNSAPTDIAAALAVIGRRDKQNLQRESENHWKLDFREADLSYANLDEFHLSGAILIGANLSMTGLIGANLIGADLFEVNLSWARLNKARLGGADLTGADLTGAILIQAHLSKEANIRGARLRNTTLRLARLFEANLSDVEELSEGQLAEAFGDDSTQLPVDFPRPPHWPAEPY